MSHLVLDSERRAVHRLLNTRFQNREKLHQAHEEAMRKDADAKSGDGDFATDCLDAVMGKPIHHLELMRRLYECNRNLYFELSPVTNRFGIYISDPNGTGTREAPFAKLRYLTMTIARGMNPEFTPKILKDDNTLKSVEHGYRAVLARLLRQGYITDSQIIQHFGLPSRSSLRWKNATT